MRYIQVELAVLWADHTWNDGHFEYVPQTDLAHGQTAIANLEKKLTGDPRVVMVTVYSAGDGQLYAADGTLLDDGVPA